jgi:hypothetical protein
LGDLLGEMGVDGGGLWAGVAEVLLDEAEVDGVFEQMGGVAMALMPGPALAP